ncbi:MAG: lipoprotein NlpI [Colwellia sp.]|nr:lipoprotein NlpI [Colwellia sp.]MCW8865425.1 lipoprotein NlpI [Colwellia sp.]MCW9082623.1 lipoprotein NlpI [Colwellia sp.]
MTSSLNKFALILLICVALLAQGCATSTGANNRSHSVGLEQLIIAEPAPVNFKSEIAIARYSDFLTRAKLTDEQNAKVLFDRGVLYDSVGLRTLARIDFTQALQLNNKLADAYNFLGIYFTQIREFSQAYEKFDSALDLDPNHEYAYLNRGIALYYGDRPELAAQDFEVFSQDHNDDPYRLLWLYLAQYQINVDTAKKNLAQKASMVDDLNWAKQVIHLYLGDITQEDFISGLAQGIDSNKALTDRLCEAYFYLGKYNQMQDNTGAAMNFFKLSISTNVYEFVEHRYAKLELDLMRTKKVTM